MSDTEILNALNTPLARNVIKSLTAMSVRESVKVTLEELKRGAIEQDEELSPEEAATMLKLVNKRGELRRDYKRTLTNRSLEGKIARFKNGKTITYSKNSIIKHIKDNLTQTF